jgi:hypothetical protein
VTADSPDIAGKWRIKLTWKLLVAISLLVVSLYWGSSVFLKRSNLAFVQKTTRITLPDTASEVQFINDPSFIHAYWIFMRCKIPAEAVDDFVARHGLERTERTELERHRDSIPDQMATVPLSGQRYYKSGQTAANLPYDILVSDTGVVLVFVIHPD